VTTGIGRFIRYMNNKAYPMGYVESELLNSTQADVNIRNNRRSRVLKSALHLAVSKLTSQRSASK
jgi:hypothetical protein